MLSVCASYLVYRAIGDKGNAAKVVKSTPVVVAARDLDAGRLIRDTDLKIIAWVGPVPKGAIAKTDGIVSRGVASPYTTANRLRKAASLTRVRAEASPESYLQVCGHAR